MKKQTVILGALAGILGLGSMGTVKMGSNHANVVEKNVSLVQENKNLKEENTKLVTENKSLKTMTDSLVEATKQAPAKVKSPENEKPSKNTVAKSDNIIGSFKVEVPIQ